MQREEMKYVVCINNDGYEAALEKRKIYLVNSEVTNLPTGLISVIDESGEDYIYDEGKFAAIQINKELEQSILNS